MSWFLIKSIGVIVLFDLRRYSFVTSINFGVDKYIGNVSE